MIGNRTRTERVVLSSIMDSPVTSLGPNITTALAFWLFWEPEASKLAGAIQKLIQTGKVPSRPMVKAALEKQYRKWVDHPMFNDGLPMRMAEHEAFDLLKLYHNKRLTMVVGNCYQKMIDKPEQAHEFALKLKERLNWL